jgi:hypothetical protein
MSSVLKADTARANGAKSRGPVTPAGKVCSAANSRRHGLASASILLDGESQEDFQLLRQDFINQFQPQTAVETDLVDVMAIARWRLRRLLEVEAHMFDLEIIRRQEQIDEQLEGLEQVDRLAFVFQELSDNSNSLTLLLRYEGSINRSYDKALKQLLELQSARQSAPPDAPLGSFRSSRKQSDNRPSALPLRGTAPIEAPSPEQTSIDRPDPGAKHCQTG